MAQFVTLIVLLILASVSLSGLFSEKELFKRTENAGEKYNEAKAREVLETVLLTDGQYEKNTNKEYNQDDFLDKLIKSEIPGSDVKGDVAIIGEYAYELDRSVPKIGRYLGKASDLVWPTVDATVKLSDDKKDATITITASEEKKGINKIEIWLLGEMIKEYKYDPSKPDATENYIATQNGTYIIKAYGDLMASKKVEVEGIVASVKFEPNGNNEWQKEHQTTVTIEETADKVVNAKYIWTNSVTTPEDGQFTEEQTFNSRDTITKNELTGTYYLWTMLETKSGEKLKWRSEGFNFDNQGPQITSFTSTAVNYSSFKLNVTAIDSQSGIVKYEFFTNGASKGTKTVDEVKTSNSQELTITNANYGNNSCYVIVTDKLGHTTRKDITATTLLDTTPPTITAFTATKYSETGITLSATAQDTGTGIVKFEFYVDNVLKGTETCTATTSSITKSKTIIGLSTGEHSCKVVVYDFAKNNSEPKVENGTTKLYAWEKFNAEYKYKCIKGAPSTVVETTFSGPVYRYASEPDVSKYFDETTGQFKSFGSVEYVTDRAEWPKNGTVRWYATSAGVLARVTYLGYVEDEPNPFRWERTTWALMSERYISGPTGTPIEVVMGIDKSQYPENGAYNEYWYKKTTSR